MASLATISAKLGFAKSDSCANAPQIRSTSSYNSRNFIPLVELPTTVLGGSSCSVSSLGHSGDFCGWGYFAEILDSRVLRITVTEAAIAQLVARRSHNPKVVSSILIRRICMCSFSQVFNRYQITCVFFIFFFFQETEF